MKIRATNMCYTWNLHKTKGRDGMGEMRVLNVYQYRHMHCKEILGLIIIGEKTNGGYAVT